MRHHTIPLFILMFGCSTVPSLSNADSQQFTYIDCDVFNMWEVHHLSNVDSSIFKLSHQEVQQWNPNTNSFFNPCNNVYFNVRRAEWSGLLKTFKGTGCSVDSRLVKLSWRAVVTGDFMRGRSDQYLDYELKINRTNGLATLESTVSYEKFSDEGGTNSQGGSCKVILNPEQAKPRF